MAHRTIRFPVPGCLTPLVFERTEDGRLVTIRADDRTYVDARAEREVAFGDGFAHQHQIELPGGLIRRWRTRRESWTENYRWDYMGRLIEVDGVRIGHDADGRVTSCQGESASWFYAYSGSHLSVIDTPGGTRHILRAPDGRPCAYRIGGRTEQLEYDKSGARLPARHCPAHWHFDDVGRLWSIADEDGEETLLTYLWDGWHCLGAISGEPGGPLSAVYSLDPTGTPVRVITSSGIRRIPRDAFGESLLNEDRIPGLFGGAAYRGLVHLPFRRLDPITGSFDSPDPANGESSDPRRAAGWTGPLPIELPASGPYTVCRNNPVSLADPTGAISDLWWLIPSALTWSMQNTIGSLLGMWLNLEFSPLGWIISAAVGAKPFDVEWISAHNFDAFGLRSDGWMSRIQPVAWTYQFLVNEESVSFTNLDHPRLFAPNAAFQPRLYGSLLRCAPASADAFLLAGQRRIPNGATVLNWSRCGGTAQPAIPGSRVPVFPEGGFHFSRVRRNISPQAATLTEVEPAGVVLTGVLDNFSALAIPGTGLGLAADANLVVTDPAGVVEIVRAISVSAAVLVTTARVDSTLARLAAAGLRVEGLSAPQGPESLAPVPSNASLLQITGSSNDYQPTVSVLRLSRNGTPAHWAKVTGFETQLAVDAAAPATVGSDFLVRTATATGNFNGTVGATPTVFNITSGAVPGAGSGMLIGSGAAAIPAIVQSVAGQEVTLDRDISSLGAPGTSTTWQSLSPVADLGQHRGAPEGGTVITYVPAAPGGAPTTGFVWLEGTVPAIRSVTGLNYEALVMSQPRSDSLADPYDVERFRVAAPDVTGATSTQALTFSLSAPLPTNATALHVVQFPGTALAAGTTLAAGANVTGTTATITVNPSSPPAGLTASEAIVLVPASGQPEAAVIRRLRLTVDLDRRLPVAATNLEAALLDFDTITYTAERRGDRVLKVRPISGPNRVDLPRFSPGDLLRAQWAIAGGTDTRLYRVVSVSGSTITCGDDAPIIPPGTAGITVTRLIVQDPATGGSRLGIEGEQGTANQITFSVWDASHFGAGAIIAVVDGATAYAAAIASTNQPLSIEFNGGGGLTGALTIAAPPAGTSGFDAEFSTDDLTLNLNSAAITAPPPSFGIVVPYADTTRSVAGNLRPGKVRIPEDHENAGLELTRRQSLDDHELTHTLQSARLGPIMLVVFPLWAVELGADLSAAGGPEFSSYVPGRIDRGVVRLTNPGSLELEEGTRIQIAQSRRAAVARLDVAVDGGGFRLREKDMRDLVAAHFRDGEVQIRRQMGGAGSDVLEWIVNIGQLLTIGGLLNVLSILGWGGIAAFITQVVNWIRAAARPDIDVQLGDDHRTLTLGEDQELKGLVEGTLVAIKKGDQTYIRAVESIAGRTVLLGFDVPLTGEVNLSLYCPRGALFGSGRRYFPGAIPDEARPGRIQVLPLPGARLSLAVHDRIEIRHASGTAFRTLVTLVEEADDTVVVEVTEPALLSEGMVNEFLVSKIAEQDPTGWVDQWLLNELNISWMQYFHDPWGQIVYRAQPTSTAGQVFARAARYLFGTQSWMCIFLGFFWNDNAYRRANAERSRMEQEASRKSGDTYCPLGSLHGDVAFVGDIARYWFTGIGGRRDNDPPQDMINFSLQDAPGVNLTQAPTITMPAGSNFAVAPDLLQIDNAGAFTGIGHRGWVPAGAELERSAGYYFAFTRPPAAGQNYLITAQAAGGVTAGDIATSVSAQNDGAATFRYNRTPGDVTVTIPDQPVAEGATLNLIPFQRATFTVTPNGSRVYRVTAAELGTTFDVDGLALTARNALVTDDVEISRFHRFNAATGTFDSGLGPVHLPADIDIAVRRFQVTIQDTIPLRATIDPAAAAVTAVVPGDSGFILVPAILSPAAVSTSVTGTPSLNPATASETTIPAEVRPFLGDGGVIRVTFPADQPPEAQATVTITVFVGPDVASSVPVRCEVTVNPHFTLDRDGGGAAEVARGASTDLVSSDGTTLNPVSSITGVTLTPNGNRLTVAVDVAFVPSTFTLLVADSANANRMARRTLAVV